MVDETKPTPQEGPGDIQQDQVLSGDGLSFSKTIPERSSSKSVISNVAIQQLSSPKPQERMTDFCKISFPDPTVLTTVGNILLSRNQSHYLEDPEDQRLSSNSLLRETSPEKFSLKWSEDKGVEQPPCGSSSEKAATKFQEDFTMPATPALSAVTGMNLSRDQHLSGEPIQNLSHNLFTQSLHTISSTKPRGGIADTLQTTFPEANTYTKDKDILLTKDQSQGLEVQQAPKLPSGSLSFETPLKKSSIRSVDVHKRLALPHRSSKDAAIGTHEDASLPDVTVLTHVTGMLSAQDQAQLVVEAKQDQCLPHDIVIADVKGDKAQSIMIGSQVPLSGPGTTTSPPFFAECIAIKPDLEKTPISMCTSSKKLESLPTGPDALIERENTTCQMTEAQIEAGDMDNTKILSKSTILKPYTLERSRELHNERSDNVTKTSLQTQAFRDHKHILHEYPLEGQHDQNLPSNAVLYEFIPERASPTSAEPQQQSSASDKPSAGFTRSPEITLPDSHCNITNILLARDQPQGLEAQQDKKPPSDLFIFQTPREKSGIWPTSVVRGDGLKLPTTLSSMSSENISTLTHEDVTLINLTALTPEPGIPSATEKTHLLTEGEQDVNKQHGGLISDVNIGQVPKLSTPFGKSNKNIISSHEELSSSDARMFTKKRDEFVSRNLNQEQVQTLALSFPTSSKDRQSSLARSADVPGQSKTTTCAVEEAELYEEDVGTIKSSLKQVNLERADLVSESSEFTKMPRLQTQSFGDHKHAGHDYPLNNEQDQQLPSKVPVPVLETSSGTWSESIIVGVDVRQKSTPSGKPSEKYEGSFEGTSPDSIVHSMATGITPSSGQQVLEKLPNDSFLFENRLVQSSVAWTKSVVSDPEIQQLSMPFQKPSESIIHPGPLTQVTDLTTDQGHISFEDENVQMLSNDTIFSDITHDSASVMGSKSVEVQQPLALFEKSSSHKETILPESTISQVQKKSTKFATLHQDTQAKHPYPSVTLYPCTSPDHTEISDTFSKPLQSTHNVQCIVESPTMLRTPPSAEGEESAVEGSSLSLCPLVTQELNNVHIKANEVAKFVCCINPQTLSNAVWYHNDKRLVTTERIKFDQSGNILSLLIYDVRPEDQGTYSCVVKNKDGKTQMTSAQLDIEGGYLTCNPHPNSSLEKYSHHTMPLCIHVQSG